MLYNISKNLHISQILSNFMVSKEVEIVPPLTAKINAYVYTSKNRTFARSSS